MWDVAQRALDNSFAAPSLKLQFMSLSMPSIHQHNQQYQQQKPLHIYTEAQIQNIR